MKYILLFVISILLIFTAYLSFITFLSVGTGGDSSQSRYLIPLGIAFIAEIIGLSIGKTYDTEGALKIVVIGLIIPCIALMIGFSQNQNDVQNYKDKKAAYEAACTIRQIKQYSYKVCAGGFSPIGVCDKGYGPECANAIKVWDQNN